MISESEAPQKLHKNEGLKENSRFLRGTILEGLADESTGAISAEDQQLIKFHGIYQQDDRDLRKERRKQKLERAFQFMIRVRVPGGVTTPTQWLMMDRLADEHANGTLKLTTRQAYQLHGVLKKDLKRTIQGINESLMDTIAACGDVNRNVMCNPNPNESAVHPRVQEVAQAISDHLTPRTSAYHEIWLDGEKVASSEEEVEPIYGKTYLPRKFKIAIAIPPSNDVDVFAHCLGYIAIVEDGELVGFNVTVGGGMGMTHKNEKTFPRLADVMGFCTVEQAVAVAEAVVKVQRDHGDRSDRAHARLKYTVDDHGVDWFRERVEEHLDFKIQPARDFKFDSNNDRYGWHKAVDGTWNLQLYITHGRIKDVEGFPMKTGLREIAKVHQGDFRLTANQNLIIGSIPEEERPRIEALLKEYGMEQTYENITGLRRSSLACVALPTCGLALTDSERYLPELVTKIDKVIYEAGLQDTDINVRMTGCPNGCARPYLGEIGFVGKAPNKYNMYLGAAHDGSRISRLYRESITEDEILETLDPMLRRYASERNSGEAFGDWVHRANILPEWQPGTNYHEPTIAKDGSANLETCMAE